MEAVLRRPKTQFSANFRKNGAPIWEPFLLKIRKNWKAKIIVRFSERNLLPCWLFEVPRTAQDRPGHSVYFQTRCPGPPRTAQDTQFTSKLVHFDVIGLVFLLGVGTDLAYLVVLFYMIVLQVFSEPWPGGMREAIRRPSGHTACEMNKPIRSYSFPQFLFLFLDMLLEPPL